MADQDDLKPPQIAGEKPWEPTGQIQRSGAGQPSDEGEHQVQLQPERGDNLGINREIRAHRTEVEEPGRRPDLAKEPPKEVH